MLGYACLQATALLLAMMLRAIQVDSTGVDDDDDLAVVTSAAGGRSSLRQPLMRHQMSYPAPGHGSYPPSASTSPPESHVSGHAAPAGYPAVGVPSLHPATSSSAGVSAHHAPGTAPIASMSDAWRTRLLEKVHDRCTVFLAIAVHRCLGFVSAALGRYVQEVLAKNIECASFLQLLVKLYRVPHSPCFFAYNLPNQRCLCDWMAHH